MFPIHRKRQGVRWFVSVDDRGACGGVWRECGWWRGEVWPRERDVLGGYFRTRARAMQQVQRFIVAHPTIGDVIEDPRGRTGRNGHRPDWRLAEYLRGGGRILLR